MTCRVIAENVAGSWEVASTVFPPLAPRRVARSWCGLEGEVIDGVPLIGPAVGLDGLYVATGFSGHGFQLAPAVGRAVADVLIGKGDDALAELQPSRFMRLDPEQVRAFKMDPVSRPLGTLG